MLRRSVRKQLKIGIEESKKSVFVLSSMEGSMYICLAVSLNRFAFMLI